MDGVGGGDEGSIVIGLLDSMRVGADKGRDCMDWATVAGGVVGERGVKGTKGGGGGLDINEEDNLPLMLGPDENWNDGKDNDDAANTAACNASNDIATDEGVVVVAGGW